MVTDSLYVIGDDARQVLRLDREHRIVDSIILFGDGQSRIGKAEKPDFESAFVVNATGKPYLVVVGSFSTENRCQVGWVNLATQRLEKLNSLQLPRTFSAPVNIEGSTLMGKHLMLANRANSSQPVNQLFVLNWNNGDGAQAGHIVPLRFPASKTVMGVSDIFYHAQRDWLLFTASTENTADAYSDGAIGDSYIGYIKNISAKLGQPSITPDGFLNLTPYLGSGQTYKIEALAVEKDSAGKLLLHLAADNDDGQSTLFKLRWKP